MPKRIVDAQADSKGNITGVRLEGNTTFTPLARAVKMAERGEIAGAHAVHPKGRDPYMRSNPDGEIGNNLDELAER